MNNMAKDAEIDVITNRLTTQTISITRTKTIPMVLGLGELERAAFGVNNLHSKGLYHGSVTLHYLPWFSYFHYRSRNG